MSGSRSSIRDIPIAFHTSEHEVSWRLVPMGEVSVERKAIQTIDAAVSVGSGERFWSQQLDEPSSQGVMTFPISSATLIESLPGSRASTKV